MKDIEKFEKLLELYNDKVYHNSPDSVALEKELIEMYKESLKLKEFYKERYDDLLDRG